MNIMQAYAQIKEDEGEVKENGLHVPYMDPLGFCTIGHGILLDGRKGGGLTDREVEFIEMNRIQDRLEALQDKILFWDDLSSNRQMALLNLSYQVGVNGVLNFKKMIAALAIGHWDRAYIEALDSKWAKQTPNRAKRVATVLKNG